MKTKRKRSYKKLIINSNYRYLKLEDCHYVLYNEELELKKLRKKRIEQARERRIKARQIKPVKVESNKTEKKEHSSMLDFFTRNFWDKTKDDNKKTSYYD